MRDKEKDAVGEDEGGGEVKQISKPNYHMENHTACQTCGWTKNAIKGDGKRYKYAIYGPGLDVRGTIYIDSRQGLMTLNTGTGSRERT